MQNKCLSDIQLSRLQILWDYMRTVQPLKKSDCIVGLGCYNLDIPKWCARLYHEGWAKKVLFSGGLGRNTKSMWQRSEAELFAEIAVDEGVPATDILLENQSTNTAENIRFTRRVLAENGMENPSLILVHKPYMLRRVAAAWPVYWPGSSFLMTTGPQTLEEYLAAPGGTDHSEAFTANMIVGDFQRIAVYAERGYQLPQEIPRQVQEAFEALVRDGFTLQLVR